MIKNANKIKLIAFYLPQYHPIPENDMWWGKGFTEWTNTAKAKPLFKGHYQPHIPADLGFYDLRVSETRQAQADLAREYGIEAFCYYHYWFGGKRLLERPLEEVTASGQPDLPFCICWANQTWSGVWHGAPDRILIEQTYPGFEDHQSHFDMLLAAFRDKRYLTIEGKPLFLIYDPMDIPDLTNVMSFWRKMAKNAGLPDLYLVANAPCPDWNHEAYGFDAAVSHNLPERPAWVPKSKPVKWLKWKINSLRRRPTVYLYKDVMLDLIGQRRVGATNFPCLIPNWDNTPRSGPQGMVLHGSRPELFKVQIRKALEMTAGMGKEHRIIIIKSWNEWAEGNHLEPDLKFGHGYLQAIRDEISNYK